MAPKGFLGYLSRIPTHQCDLLLLHLGEFKKGVNNAVADLIEVVVGTMNGLNAIFNLACPSLYLVGQIPNPARSVVTHGT